MTAIGRLQTRVVRRWVAVQTIRNHTLHHTALSYEDTRCNYGNSVILWDRVFGTYREGESAIVG